MAGLWLQAGGAFEGATRITSPVTMEQSRDKGQAHLHKGNDFVDKLSGDKRPMYDDDDIDAYLKRVKEAKDATRWAADRMASVIK